MGSELPWQAGRDGGGGGGGGGSAASFPASSASWVAAGVGCSGNARCFQGPSWESCSAIYKGSHIQEV